MCLCCENLAVREATEHNRAGFLSSTSRLAGVIEKEQYQREKKLMIRVTTKKLARLEKEITIA